MIKLGSIFMTTCFKRHFITAVKVRNDLSYLPHHKIPKLHCFVLNANIVPLYGIHFIHTQLIKTYFASSLKNLYWKDTI